MKINKIFLVILVIILVGCSSIHTEPTPTFARNPTITPQPTKTPKPSPTATLTIPQEKASRVKVTSMDNPISIEDFDWAVSSLYWSDDGKKLIIGPVTDQFYIFDVQNKSLTANPLSTSRDFILWSSFQ